jgi:TolB-like protein/Flp pilus assembly protein TadD
MSIFAELRRRNVFRVGIAYAVTAWLLIQVADILLETIGAPPWVMQTLFVVLGIGLVIALFFAWAYELTPEGVKRESEVDRSQSITPQTGQKLNRAIIMIMALALVYFTADKFYLSPARQDSTTADTTRTAVSPDEQNETIAVLPFVDMSPAGDNEYFSDGLTEELLNILAKIKELRVAGRTSSFAFKGKNQDLRSIGEKLNVSSILEGSVRKDEKNNRVRITAQLVNVDDGFHLWSETYDRDLTDIFAIQEEIAREVAGALRVTLLGEVEAQIDAHAVTDISAYDLYLRGMQQLNIFSFDSLRQAIDILGQALEKDPGYQPARLHLAQAWLDLAFTGAVTQGEGISEAEPLLRQVLENDPDNAPAHVLMARIMARKQDRVAQRDALELALNSDPRNVPALREMGRMVMFVESDVAKAFEYLNEAERIEPYSIEVLWDLMAFNAFTGQPEKTLPYAQRTAELQPGNPNRYWGPGMAYQLDGQLATSLDYQVKASNVDTADYELTAGIASTWLALGDLEQAERWLALAEKTGADQPTPTAVRVLLYQAREQYGIAADMARRGLERGLDNRQGSNGVLIRAYVSHLYRQGDIQTALDFYREQMPGMFTTPIDLSGRFFGGPLSGSMRLLEAASLMQKQAPGSERAEQLIDIAEQRILATDPGFIPWQRELEKASLAAIRNNGDAALEHLSSAMELGLRYRWQNLLYSNIALASLHGNPDFTKLVAKIEDDMQMQREMANRLPGVLQ